MIVTKENFDSILNHLKGCPRLSLDTETTGVRPFHGSLPFSIIIGVSREEAYYFNLWRYLDIDQNLVIPLDKIKALNELFSMEKTWFMHNAKFDMHILKTIGLEITGKIHCTQITALLLDNQRQHYSLESLAPLVGMAKDSSVEDYIDEHKLYTMEDVPGVKKKNKNKHYFRVPFDIISKYGEMDAMVTFALGEWQLSEMERLDRTLRHNHSSLPPISDVYETECELLKAVQDMEWRGAKIDTKYCREALVHEEGRCAEAIALFKRVTGKEFKASGKLFAEVFADQKDRWVYTDKGNPSFAADILREFVGDAANAIRAYMDAKSRANFFNSLLYHVDSNGYVHASLDQDGTVTGRFCVRKGTKIEIVRNVSKYPDGVPIEEVKVGDYAYCYDEDLRLTVKKVLWAGKTGRKKVIRIHWLGQGRKTKGYLDLTPEHLVRRVTGEYVKASELKEMDRLLAMGRSTTNGYGRIHSRDCEYREHRLIAISLPSVFGGVDESIHIHHKNKNKLDNTLGNLEALSIKEHISNHSKELAKKRHNENVAIAKSNWEKGLFKVKHGGECGRCYKRVSKFSLLRSIIQKGGSIARLETAGLTDFNTVKKKLREYGIEFKNLSKMFNMRGEKLSKKRLLEAMKYPYPENLKVLGVNYYKFRDLMAYYGIKPWNHVVTKIEHIEVEDDVYDLEIEETHNFIANEICVHNSSKNPNLQNQPDEEKSHYEWKIRKAFIPEKDTIIFCPDYSAMEFRVMLHYAGEDFLIDAINNGEDQHEKTAIKMGLASEQSSKEALALARKPAKTLNFMLLYGGGITKLASSLFKTTLGDFQLMYLARKHIYEMAEFRLDSEIVAAGRSIPEEKIEHNLGELRKAQDLRDRYFSSMPKVKKFLKDCVDKVAQRGFAITWAGRYLKCPKGIAYKMPNALIQGGCADITKRAMVACYKLLKGSRSRMWVTVHDEIGFYIHHEERHFIPSILSIMDTVFPAKKIKVIAQGEWSDTNWAEKKVWDGGKA